MTTIRDVAQLAGVSIATISRVLNNSEKVSPDTAEHVRSVIKELGYVYSPPLSNKRTPAERQSLFAIILPTLANPYFSELLDIVEQEAQFLGRALLVFNSRGDTQRELTLMNACKQYKIDGLFIIPCTRDHAHLETENSLPFPVVILTQLLQGKTSVAVDHIEGGAQVAEHLVSMGHTQIGYLGATDETEQKFSGFRDKLAELGVPLLSDNIIQTPALTAAEIADRFKEYLDDHPQLPFSAIFAFNDVAAQQVMDVLHQRGYQIPEQVQVVGFDNTLLAQVMNISSVAQPMREIGRLGCQEMIRLVEGKEMDTHHLSLSPRLVLRNSSVKVNKRTFSPG
jgi:LacI family transcriptional regulator